MSHKIHLILDTKGFAIQEECGTRTRVIEGPWPNLQVAVDQYNYLMNLKEDQFKAYLTGYLKLEWWNEKDPTSATPTLPISLASYTI